MRLRDPLRLIECNRVGPAKESEDQSQKNVPRFYRRRHRWPISAKRGQKPAPLCNLRFLNWYYAWTPDQEQHRDGGEDGHNSGD
jgi:hypothetical protein